MATAKKSKIPPFVTAALETKWSNLLSPDTAFGEGSANHNITIVVDTAFKKVLDQALKTSGAKKLNGLRETDEGVLTFKAKSKVHVEEGKFPCFDSQGNPTTTVPFGGDKVRLRLSPKVLERDNSLSIYLSGIQIIEKNSATKGSGTQGFEAVEGGFVDTPTAAAQIADIEDDAVPF